MIVVIGSLSVGLAITLLLAILHEVQRLMRRSRRVQGGFSTVATGVRHGPAQPRCVLPHRLATWKGRQQWRRGEQGTSSSSNRGRNVGGVSGGSSVGSHQPHGWHTARRDITLFRHVLRQPDAGRGSQPSGSAVA